MGQLYSCFVLGWGHVINLIFRIIINSYLQTDEINQCMYELFILNMCLSSVLIFNVHYNNGVSYWCFWFFFCWLICYFRSLYSFTCSVRHPCLLWSSTQGSTIITMIIYLLSTICITNTTPKYTDHLFLLSSQLLLKFNLFFSSFNAIVTEKGICVTLKCPFNCVKTSTFLHEMLPDWPLFQTRT